MSSMIIDGCKLYDFQSLCIEPVLMPRMSSELSGESHAFLYWFKMP